MEAEKAETLTQQISTTATPALQRKTEQTQKISDMDIGVRKLMHGSRRRSRRCRREQRSSVELKVEQIKEVMSTARNDDGAGKNEAGCVGKEEEGEDEREEIEKKIEALQRIVPGGEALGVDKLFDETAGYIVTLQYQVKALRALQSFFEKLEKEGTKLGG
ncbi:hypothetical protein L6164_029337 [Bauhinia variegata]|uniref:Uncharacterized protein n=1 Tax=Bauhinia variegata TaxID=167791 RepID=A0ACB9L9R8_BAUVA|nr:hypothetical protein L6164_029337 [Bauhinia variegata]